MVGAVRCIIFFQRCSGRLRWYVRILKRLVFDRVCVIPSKDDVGRSAFISALKKQKTNNTNCDRRARFTVQSHSTASFTLFETKLCYLLCL